MIRTHLSAPDLEIGNLFQKKKNPENSHQKFLKVQEGRKILVFTIEANLHVNR